MSKASHSFSVEIAKQEGLAEAIILQHIHFLQTSGAESDLPAKDVWVKRSVRAYHLTYEYLTDRQIRNALDRLEIRGVIRSKTDNKNAYDRTKSFQLDEKGWRYFQPEKPISETENAFDKKSNGSDEKANGVARNVKSNIGSYNSFIGSFVECESAHAPAPENQNLKAEKETPPPSSAPPPPPGPQAILAAERQILEWAKGEGLETVKMRCETARRSFTEDDLPGIVAHYVSIYGGTSQASKETLLTDPVGHFATGFYRYLINQNTFDRGKPGESQQKTSGRSTLNRLGADPAKYAEKPLF